MELFTVLIGLLVSLLTIYILLPKPRPKNFPPGPRANVPIFGNAFEFGKLAHKRMMVLEKQYGPIIGLQAGSYWKVILNNVEDIREAFSRPEFSGRFGYHPFLEENISVNTKGVVMSFGQKWQDSRRRSLKCLRNHGFGKQTMESIIIEEVQDLIQILSKKLNEPISTHGMFNASVLNVLWIIVAGQRFKRNDQQMTRLLTFIYELMRASTSGIKFLNFLFPILGSLRETVQIFFPDLNKRRQEALKIFLKETVQEHRDTLQLGEPRDFIDTYLEEEIMSEENLNQDDSDLIYTLMDLFGAGSETTSTTLNWAFFFLALHPEPQEKLYEEIQSIAENRIVRLVDRPNMPYCEAIIAETHRMASLAAMGVPHATTQPVKFKGYDIPKNSIVFGNFYACHFNKETWGDPHNFRPERFIDENGKFIRHPHLIPFSVGKRQCMGEQLARDELFIVLTNMVQQLKITLPPDEPHHSIEGHDGLILTPELHRIILSDRNNNNFHN